MKYVILAALTIFGAGTAISTALAEPTRSYEAVVSEYLRTEFAIRSSILYKLQEARLLQVAWKIRLGNGGPDSAEFTYHRPDLFDRRSFGILGVNDGNQVWVSATDKYVHGKNVDKLYPVNESSLFDRQVVLLEEPKIGGDLMSQARKRLAMVNDYLTTRERFMVDSRSELEVRTKSLSAGNRRFDVSAAVQILKLKNGEVCQVSTWISDTDKYFDVLCLTDDGVPARPALIGGWSKNK